MALLGVLTTMPALAQTPSRAASDWVITEQTMVRLIAGETATQTFGLQFKLKPGWKIYWRSPGDAGFPPKPDWSRSKNIQSVAMSWPRPERFSVLGLETLGYKKEVVFPISVTAIDNTQDIALSATVPYLTCAEICIPYTAALSLSVPANEIGTNGFATLITRYQQQVPAFRDDFKITKVTTDKSTQDGEPITRLFVTATADKPFSKPDLFIEGPPELAFSKPEMTLDTDKAVARMTIQVYGAETSIAGQSLTMTLVDGERASETPVRVLETIKQGSGEKTAETKNKPQTSTILTILLFAFLGGLILNLMPCVLPVLSIKLLSVVKSGGQETKRVRYGFLASVAGIVSAFVILASVLITLKSLGLTIGWGIQFQQPWFLITMVLVMTLFACNMLGVFEFSLPGWIGSRAGNIEHNNRIGGHFFQGMLATILATPCSAPFLGTAVGFALARGPVEILTIFIAVGVGLSVPYLLVAAFPKTVRHIPKPGPWMERLKQFLALLLIATVVWLLSILSANIGFETALASGVLAFVMAGTLITFKYIHKDRISRPGWAATVILSLFALAIPSFLGQNVVGAPTVKSADKDIVNWVKWDKNAIPALVKQGKTVFVDVTAEWCITCQVNKNLVLHRDQAAKLLQQDNVVAMTADWTKPDPAISDYLSEYERYGIPFNIIYGPGAPDGVILPELLSQNAVVEAFAKASPKTENLAKN